MYIRVIERKRILKVRQDNNIPPSTLSDWKKVFLDSIGMKEKEDRKLSETEKELQKTQEIPKENERETERLWKEQYF